MQQDEQEPTGTSPETTEETAGAAPATDETGQQTGQTADDAGAQPQQTPGVQKRINELTRNWRETERERDYWREMALQRAAQQQPEPQPAGRPPPPPAGQRPQRPTEEQFEYDAQKYQAALVRYEEELVDWRIAQRDAQTRAQQEAEAARRRQLEEAQTFQAKRDRTVTEGREKYPDFEELVFGLPANVMTADVAADVFEAEHPADVAYYLGKNPEEAAKIAQMGARQRAIRIGAIDARIGQAAARKATGAPAPPPKFSGAGSAPRDPARLARENPGEYMRLRNEGKI